VALMLEVSTEQHPGQTRVALTGELDIASADGLEQQLEAAEVDSPAILVLDLRRLEFIDSTGLRTLVSADERARSQGRRMAVICGPNAVARILEVTQLDQRLEILDDPDALGA
jgi:anti-sigma B factor antagonist